MIPDISSIILLFLEHKDDLIKNNLKDNKMSGTDRNIANSVAVTKKFQIKQVVLHLWKFYNSASSPP
jgi:hypothetical protein